MDLFKLKYNEEIEVLENKISSRLIHGRVFFEAHHFGSYTFQDNEGNEWIYTEGVLQINFQNIEVGTHYFTNGTTLIRASTPEEVIQKAEEYFLPFVVKESRLIIKIREEDYLNLN